jgi:hypothetical protein
MICFETTKGRFALIEVHKYAQDATIYNNEFRCRFLYGGEYHKQALHLPTGVYQFICFSNNITDAEAERIVEQQDKRFACYERGENEKWFLIARQSFLSLLAEHRLTHNYAILKVICSI